MTGFSKEEVLGQDFAFVLKADPHRPDRPRLREAGRDGESWDDLICCKDGSELWAAILRSPVEDKFGVIVQHFVSFVDLTAHKLEAAHSKMLIDELNHRVKNTLATVLSIVGQALRKPIDIEGFGESVESRLFALSRSHDLLTNVSWEGAGLRDLIGAALEPFGVSNGRSERFEMTGKNLLLPPNATLALGIAFHELATNAVKYGAFSNDSGFVRIAWTAPPSPAGPRLRLKWEERGGPPVAVPSRRGFGSQVIERGLGHELHGAVRLEFLPAGVTCAIDVPLPVVARDG